MPNRLRRILFSVPVITLAGLLAFYAVAGFLALPAIVKWQVEKQVNERLGHRISVAEVRFNPFSFRFEIEGVALSDPEGRPMLGFRRALVDFELRSVIDRAWTFADAVLEAPALSFGIEKDGRNNFSALLERLADSEEPDKEAGALPRIVVRRLMLSEGRVELSDALLEPTQVTRIEPLVIEIGGLSTMPGQAARFRIAAWTAAGETFETRGEFGLNPVASKGQLKLGAAQVSTFIRGLSRVLALDSGSGTVDFSADYDVALDSAGNVSGGAHDVGLDVSNLSVAAVGAEQPLIAIDTLSLKQGRIDLDTRDVSFAGFRIAKGSAAASADANGTIDWAKIVRVSAAQSEKASASHAANSASTANTASPANAPSTANASPWKLSVASTQISEIALSYSDAAQGRHAKVAALGVDVATSAQIGSAGMRIEIDKPRVSIAGARVENGSDFVGLPGALVQAERISISSAGRRFDLAFDSPSVALAEGLSARQGDASLELRAVSVQGGRVELGGADASMSGAIDVPKITASGVAVDQSGQKAALADASFEASRISLQAGESRFDVAIDKLRTTLAALKAERGDEGLDLRNASIVGEKLSVGQADGTVRVLAASPVVELSGVAARRGAERAKLETFSFASGSVSLASGGGARDGGSGAKLDLAFEKIRGAASALAMNSGADGIDLRNAAVGGESVTVSQRDGVFSVAGRGARASVAGVAARQGADRIVLQDAEFEAAALSASSGGAVSGAAMRSAAGTETPGALKAGASTTGVATAGGTALDARIDGVALRLASLDVTALGASSELARVGQANIAAKSLAMRMAKGPLELTGEGLSAALSKVLVRSPADATDLVRVGSAKLNGGTLRLRDRLFSAEQLELADGQAKTWIDAQGRLNLLTAFEAPSAPGAAAAAPRSSATAKTSQPAGQATADAPWRIAMKSIALDGFAVGFEDRSQSPALVLGVDAIRARVAGLDTVGQTPMKIEFDANLASGGQLQARGEVRADNGQSDLAVKVAGLVLAPVQPYLSKFAELRLASGTVSTEGRLRYGDAARANAKLAYEGRIAIERLLLEENEPKRPFVSWDAVVSDDVVFTLEPNRVDIGELRIDGPSGRLIIAEDQSVNLMDVLKKPKGGEKADGAGKEPKLAAEPEKAPDEDPFPVTIARLRVSGGVLEFADLSLRPQFGTRMHELEGVVTGLGTDVNRSAKVQLDARVDKYGSAKIRGQLSVMRPEKLTDIELSFRNLEMTALSPYVAKFAGYRIASGRLALDLQYKVDNRKLLGQNKVVLNQVELGEKVDSPDALDLPLELAIAILKDSKGVIDIGLPVSGDLGDPKFDYGAVIGKAIGNLLGGIVTAPFRMLGALFASGDKKIDSIDFEPGSATIAPPERQKLEAVARALKERPGLSLRVPPTYATAEDTPALKSRAVRRDIVTRMGVELKPGEDPGPIDTANPRAQRAVETTFSERYAPEVLAALKRRAAEQASPTTGTPVKESAAPTASATAAQSAASAAMASAASPAPSSAETPAKAAGTGAQRPARPARGPSPEFYQSLVDRLIAEQPLTEPMLAQLATRRGEAIVRELTTVGGVPEARVALGEPRKATESGDKAVTLRLELEVAK